MYKSSPLTFVFQYIFPSLMLFGGMLGIYFLYQVDGGDMTKFTIYYTISLAWISIFLVQLPFRLKRIVANQDGVTIKSWGTESFVGYDQIEWISKLDFSNPWGLTLQYVDPNSGKRQKISYLPNSKHQRIFQEDEMTEFIKRRIEEENPNFHKIVQPSTLRNLGIIFLLFIPFLALLFYFGI